MNQTSTMNGSRHRTDTAIESLIPPTAKETYDIAQRLHETMKEAENEAATFLARLTPSTDAWDEIFESLVKIDNARKRLAKAQGNLLVQMPLPFDSRTDGDADAFAD